MRAPETFTIRPATYSDIPEADALHRAEHPNDKYTYADNIRRASTINYVAESYGKVVGFVTVLVNPPNPDPDPRLPLWHRMRPYIGFIVVAKGMRRSGIGKKLTIASAIEAMSRYGSDDVYLECRTENTPALAMYDRLGFQKVSADDVQSLFRRPPGDGSFVFRATRDDLA